MEKQAADRLVHHYDTQQHRILCRTAGAEDHSTKHPRGVTCPACVELLRQKAAGDTTGAAASSGTV
jgi:hypothetical protein